MFLPKPHLHGSRLRVLARSWPEELVFPLMSGGTRSLLAFRSLLWSAAAIPLKGAKGTPTRSRVPTLRSLATALKQPTKGGVASMSDHSVGLAPAKSWPKVAVGQMTSLGDAEVNFQTCKRLTEVSE